MRTVHSVINRTPRQYLMEIILVDDASIHGKVPFQDPLEKIKDLNEINIVC